MSSFLSVENRDQKWDNGEHSRDETESDETCAGDLRERGQWGKGCE